MDIDSVWEYNAPQFVDFCRPIDDDTGVDEYFDIDHEGEEMLELATSAELSTSKPERNEAKLPVDDAKNNQEMEASVHEDVAATQRDSGSVEAARSSGNGVRVQPESSTKQTKRILRSNASGKHAEVDSSGQRVTVDSSGQSAEVNSSGQIVEVNSSGQSVEVKSSGQSAEVNSCVPTTDAAETSSNTIPSNVCSSVEQWRAKGARKTSEDKVGDSEVSKKQSREPVQLRSRRSNVENKPEERGAESGKKQPPRTRTNSLDRGKLAPPGGNVLSDKKKVEPVSKRRSQSQERINRLASPSLQGQKAHVGKLTMPCTPSFMKREMNFLHLNQAKTSEAQEMETIRDLRRALAEKRKMATESHAVALSATGYQPMRSRMPVTRPQEFQFASDARLKGPSAESGPASLWKEVDFAAELRKPSDKQAAVPHGPTVPQPFHLHASKKRTLSGSNCPADEGKFETMAEKLVKFSSKTPDRFRTKPTIDRRSADGLRRKIAEPDDHGLTVPKTPNLVTRTRARPTNVLSQADLDEIELEEIKKSKFKAQPFNQKIFGPSITGIRKVLPKECTVTESFDLEIEKRLEQRKRLHSESTEEPHFEFHAQPMPKKMLLGPVGVKPAKERPLTVPQSPAFATKYLLRSNQGKEEAQVEKEQAVMRATPVPHTGIPFQPKLDHRVTVVEPFSFEERTKEMITKKEDHIRKVLEEEKKAREFHAQPLKDLQPLLPERRPKRPTTPEPFNLEIEARCAIRIEEWKHKIDEENKKMKATVAFKAKHPIVLEKEPFVPAKSDKPPTETANFQLNTEKRAEKRQEWEAWNNEKATESAIERMQYEKTKTDENEREIQRLRAEAVPRANPIRLYKPVQIVPSDQPLTNPESPRFSERLKVKMLRH